MELVRHDRYFLLLCIWTGGEFWWHIFRRGLSCFLYSLGSMFAGTKATLIRQISWRHRIHTRMQLFPFPQQFDLLCAASSYCLVMFRDIFKAERYKDNEIWPAFPPSSFLPYEIHFLTCCGCYTSSHSFMLKHRTWGQVNMHPVQGSPCNLF